MDWIRVAGSIVRHPKTRRFAVALGVERVQAIGHVVSLWTWAAEYFQDGNLIDCTPEEIADGADWHGDPMLFVTSLQASGFADGLVLHDWHVYQGALIEKRERDRERARMVRERFKDSRATVARPSCDESRTVARNETRRDETRRTEETTGAPAPPTPKPTKRATFQPPKNDDELALFVRMVSDYLAEISETRFTAEHFADTYARQGWKLANGRTMTDWRACVRTWRRMRDEDDAKRRTEGGYRGRAAVNPKVGTPIKTPCDKSDIAKFGTEPNLHPRWDHYVSECMARDEGGTVAWPRFEAWLEQQPKGGAS